MFVTETPFLTLHPTTFLEKSVKLICCWVILLASIWYFISEQILNRKLNSALCEWFKRVLPVPRTQGCTYVAQSFVEYMVNRGKVILLLVEAIGECLTFILIAWCKKISKNPCFAKAVTCRDPFSHWISISHWFLRFWFLFQMLLLSKVQTGHLSKYFTIPCSTYLCSTNISCVQPIYPLSQSTTSW